MRLYVYFMSLFIALSPAYTYAFAPAIGVAIAGSVAGEVAVGVGKATIKKISPEAKKKLIKSATGVCGKNPSASAFCGGVIGAITSNDWEIEVNHTENNDIDIDIYENSEPGCYLRKAYGYDNIYYNSLSAYLPVSARKSVYMSEGWGLGYVGYDSASYNKISSELDAYYRQESLQGAEYIKNVYGDYTLQKPRIIAWGQRITQIFNSGPNHVKKDTSFNFGLYAVCYEDKKPVDNDKLVEEILKKMNGDDITNIYNYDYSQHNNIKVNNDIDTGDNVTNIKNDFDKNYKEKKLSENATQKMKHKRKGYDIDDINDENCEKNEQGEYDKCGDDRGKKDGEEETKKEDDEKKEDEKKKDDDDEPPIDCKASSFHQKVCDWIDWTQEDHDPKTDTKVDVEEIDSFSIDEDKIKFRAVCPPPKPIHINVVGRDYHTELSYQPLCDFFSGMKPFVVGLGWFSGAMIIAGRRY